MGAESLSHTKVLSGGERRKTACRAADCSHNLIAFAVFVTTAVIAAQSVHLPVVSVGPCGVTAQCLGRMKGPQTRITHCYERSTHCQHTSRHIGEESVVWGHVH